MITSLDWSYPRKAIQNISPIGEFCLIVTLCFGYSTAMSIVYLFLDPQGIYLSSLAIMRRIAVTSVLTLGVGFVLSVRGWDLHQLGFRFSWSAILAAVPLLLSYAVLYAGISLLAVRFYPLALDVHANIIPQASTGLILLMILVNSVFEEAVVSGYVVSALASRGALLSIAASTLIRLAYHLYYGPMALIGILPMGLLFAFVYWKWRNLWPLFTAHSLLNIWIFLVVPYLDAKGV